MLHACLHDERYDRQCENGRGRCLFDVLHATGEPGWYTPALQAALSGDDPEIARYQVFSLCVRLARGGEEELRPALHETFRRVAAGGEDIGAEALIASEGFAGFALVARTFTEHPLAEDEASGYPLLLNDLIERQGKEPAAQFCATLAAQEPNLAPFLSRVAREWDEWQARTASFRRRRRAGPATYETARAQIESPSKACRRWSDNLSDAAAARLAEDFLAETDPSRLRKYLRQFGWRPFPLHPARLIEMTRGDDDNRLMMMALSAAGNVTHPEVRAAALDFLCTEGREWRGVRLLAANPGEGDIARIESILLRPEDFSLWEYHSMGIDARDYFDANPTPESIPSLRLLYEYGPCSMCRASTIKMLLLHDAFTPEMQRESLYDADSGARELAATRDPHRGE